MLAASLCELVSRFQTTVNFYMSEHLLKMFSNTTTVLLPPQNKLNYT